MDKNKVIDRVYKDAFNYTLPRPFDITDEKRSQKVQVHCEGMLEGEKEFDELKVGIKALPLNKEILEPKLEDMEERRKKRS